MIGVTVVMIMIRVIIEVEDGWKASKMMSRAQSSVTANYTVMCQSGPRRKYQGKLTLIKVHAKFSLILVLNLLFKEFPEDGTGPAYKWLPTQVINDHWVQIIL